EILAGTGRIDEALALLQASVGLAKQLQTRREIWVGSVALGKTLNRLGKYKEAEAALMTAYETVETIATMVTTDYLIQSFVSAQLVREIFKMLGRRPPDGDR